MGKRDDNERARAGELPPDPFADTEDVPPPAREEARKTARNDAPRGGRSPSGDGYEERVTDVDDPAWEEVPPPDGPDVYGREERPSHAGGRRSPLDTLRPLAELLPGAVAKMEARRDGVDRPVPLPDAWPRTAAELHGGLWPGCHVLVGGTGAGKSQWAFEVAFHAARRGTPVAYVGLELDELGIVARLAALAAGADPRRVPWRDLYYGRREALADACDPRRGALDVLDRAPFYPVTGDARGWDYRRIASLAAQLRERHPKSEGPALIIVDFLQLVSAPPGTAHRAEGLREIIGGAAYAARMAAREHDAAVLLLSSAARGYYPLFQGRAGDGKGDGKGEGRADPLGAGDRSRFVGTGKESGEVEYAADTVLALGREPWADGEPRPPVWLAVAKSRTGPPAGDATGWIRYGFDGSRFEERGPHSAERAADRPASKPAAERARQRDPAA